MSKGKISLEPYKGVRDFYPEDMAIHKWMCATMRMACERVGFEEYNASVLEPSELYIAKSSEEILNEETYTFRDRGDRSVTLRPEMTPTVARMVAARKRELAYPLRWYSIPNLFRYDRPQKGRLREHWQLNVDTFGVSNMQADIEIIGIAHGILRAFGASEEDFEIKINDRTSLMETLDASGLTDEEKSRFVTLLDKREKMDPAQFESEGIALLGRERLNRFLEEQERLETSNDTPSHRLLAALQTLPGYPMSNVRIDRGLVRGFSYYTGMVFEVFDTNPENRRALFGGGRYDKLIGEISGEDMPAVGFGMGDVSLRDFLETHALLPTLPSPTRLAVCLLKPEYFGHAVELSNIVRGAGVNTSIDFSGRKVGDQIKAAAKKGVPYVFVIGEEELASGLYKLKDLRTGEEEVLSIEAIAEKLS